MIKLEKKVAEYLIDLGFTSADELKIIEIYSGTLSREEIKKVVGLLYDYEAYMEKEKREDLKI